MIEIKKLVEELQEKLNKSISGLEFVLSSDTAKFKRSLRIQNTIAERINGLVKVNSSDVTNLADGKLFATISCNLKIIFKLEGKEENETINIDGNQRIIPGYKQKIDAVRLALTNAFQNHEQGEMTETIKENGRDIEKKYLVLKLYQFPDSGERLQVQELGDSYSFNVYISYMFVEGGISTYDVVYTLDGNIIPFETNTAYRTPTMDGNVYADTIDGATKNLVSQTTFSVSFQLPALKNSVTKQMFNYLFGGKVNQAHILNVKDKAWGTEYNYLVVYGENNLTGNTILNLGQQLTLMEAVDDYELLSFPSNLAVYEIIKDLPNDTKEIHWDRDFYFYNITKKQFGFYADTQEDNRNNNWDLSKYPLSKGDIIITTANLYINTDYITALQTITE